MNTYEENYCRITKENLVNTSSFINQLFHYERQLNSLQQHYPHRRHYTNYLKSSLLIVTTTTFTDWTYLKETKANEDSILAIKMDASFS